MPLNPLDWLISALLLYSAVRAAMNGFFREAFTLGGVVLGFPLACWYFHDVAHALAGLLTSPPVAQIAAFALILTVTTVTATLCGHLFRRGARTVGLGAADRLGGAVFGLLRGAAVAVALLMALTAFLPAAPWVKTSLLAPYLLHAAHAVSFTMPPDLRERLLQGLEHLNHSSAGWIKSGPLSHTRIITTEP